MTLRGLVEEGRRKGVVDVRAYAFEQYRRLTGFSPSKYALDKAMERR